MGVVQVGHDPGVLAQTLDLARVSQAAGVDHLKGADDVEALLVGLVDDAHPRLGDLF